MPGLTGQYGQFTKGDNQYVIKQAIMSGLLSAEIGCRLGFNLSHLHDKTSVDTDLPLHLFTLISALSGGKLTLGAQDGLDQAV